MASPRSQIKSFCVVTAVKVSHVGDVIVMAFAEAMSEKKQRGGAPPRLEGLGLCGVGFALKSHLCLPSRRSCLAMCSPFSRGKEFRDLLPFPLSPEPTKAERELSMICAHGEPDSPELMHEAAVDVGMFLLKWSSNCQFEGRKVRGA